MNMNWTNRSGVAVKKKSLREKTHEPSVYPQYDHEHLYLNNFNLADNSYIACIIVLRVSVKCCPTLSWSTYQLAQQVPDIVYGFAFKIIALTSYYTCIENKVQNVYFTISILGGLCADCDLTKAQQCFGSTVSLISTIYFKPLTSDLLNNIKGNHCGKQSVVLQIHFTML